MTEHIFGSANIATYFIFMTKFFLEHLSVNKVILLSNGMNGDLINRLL